ncbi:hypothetical protein PRO82_001448 [Candidatus Protochlamydia amoebophila]|uniref:hypothetical protein n=1 Tax=Candidatus Protochlamydia amoebophila TaxID=362787 RepID=UPI001BC9C24C|nr:hypothetical protein [Candidatus Protochlamydia amoebophila]MBS4164132.1 hypothetical protein [Candidatus Protochlamydia amoebophila]
MGQTYKARLSVDCTTEEEMYIKMLVAKKQTTISEYFFARQEMLKDAGHDCNKSHELNEETAQILRETKRGENIENHDTLEDFWKVVGMKPNTSA